MASMPSTPVQVQVGEQNYTIQRFRGLKAIMAIASMTRIGREVPDIMADAMKDYQKRNTMIITEPMAQLPRWQGFEKEDFDAAEARTGRREIELPVPMTANEQIMYGLPELLQKARKEVTRLLALLLVPNQELIEADKSDSVEETLDKYQELLMYEAEIDQLVDLCLKASDVLEDQLSDKKDRLGNLARGVWGWFRKSQPSETASQSSLPQSTLPQEEEVTETLPTSSEDVPTSSTDSVEPTDGTEPQPSTVSPGVS